MITLNQKVWTSSDGWTWDRQPGLPDADAYINAVSRGGPGFVAVGAGGGRCCGLDLSRRDDLDGAPGIEASSGAFMTAVVSGVDGLVAVGDAMANDVPHAMIWASPDGRSWRKIADQASFTRGDIWGVARGGPGDVAVGGRNCSTLCPEPGPPIWTSADAGHASHERLGRVRARMVTEPHVCPHQREVADDQASKGGSDGRSATASSVLA